MHVLPWRSQGQYYWLVKNVSILLMKNFQCNKYYYFNSQLIINSCINWMSAMRKKVKKQGMLMARKKRVHGTPSSIVCLQLMHQLGHLASSGEVCKKISFDFLHIIIILLAFC